MKDNILDIACLKKVPEDKSQFFVHSCADIDTGSAAPYTGSSQATSRCLSAEVTKPLEAVWATSAINMRAKVQSGTCSSSPV